MHRLTARFHAESIDHPHRLLLSLAPLSASPSLLPAIQRRQLPTDALRGVASPPTPGAPAAARSALAGRARRLPGDGLAAADVVVIVVVATVVFAVAEAPRAAAPGQRLGRAVRGGRDGGEGRGRPARRRRREGGVAEGGGGVRLGRQPLSDRPPVQLLRINPGARTGVVRPLLLLVRGPGVFVILVGAGKEPSTRRRPIWALIERKMPVRKLQKRVHLG